MAARDKYHEQVKNALVNDGWRVTDDPFAVEYADAHLEADLGAEKLFAAEKGSRKIVVEIKIFGGLSFFNDLHTAIGQYCNYRALLRKTKHAEREVWLAITATTYSVHFQRLSTQAIVDDMGVKLLVFDQETEGITAWIP